MGRAEPLLLHGVGAVQAGEFRRHELLDLLAVFIGDKDKLIGAQDLKAADDVLEDRFAGHVDQRFGLGVGMGAQAGPLAGHGQNDFHGLLRVRFLSGGGRFR